MTSMLVLVVLAWAVTVPVVLGLARLLGRLSSPEPVEAPEAPLPTGTADNVVPLVPRPQNALLSVRDGELRRAS